MIPEGRGKCVYRVEESQEWNQTKTRTYEDADLDLERAVTSYVS